MLEQSCRATYDFFFGRIVTRLDSPRIVFTMLMDVFQPFLGQYYEVRLLPGGRSHAQPCDVPGSRTAVSTLAMYPQK